jgi:hypothetical protein
MAKRKTVDFAEVTFVGGAHDGQTWRMAAPVRKEYIMNKARDRYVLKKMTNSLDAVFEYAGPFDPTQIEERNNVFYDDTQD